MWDSYPELSLTRISHTNDQLRTFMEHVAFPDAYPSLVVSPLPSLSVCVCGNPPLGMEPLPPTGLTHLPSKREETRLIMWESCSLTHVGQWTA
jgi:hypothetical protein